MFFRSCCTNRFIEFNFCQAIEACGADSAETVESMARALAYMMGYAHFACHNYRYQSPKRRTAEFLSMACGFLLSALRSDDLTTRNVENMCTQYAAELQLLASKVA